jgi:hypothetical protein
MSQHSAARTVSRSVCFHSKFMSSALARVSRASAALRATSAIVLRWSSVLRMVPMAGDNARRVPNESSMESVVLWFVSDLITPLDRGRSRAFQKNILTFAAETLHDNPSGRPAG